MTLNMWGYFDWKKRKDTLNAVVDDQSPDIVALQEVQLNTQFSHSSQVEVLAKNLGYTYFAYSPVWGRTDHMHWDEHKETRLSHGLGFMSKYPIISVESYFLLQQPDHDEPYNMQLIELDIDGDRQLFCNVHFGNSDNWSELHLRETMKLCKDRNITPILLGDFNNFNLEQFKTDILKDYFISTEIASYKSMPKDNGTLDYIVVPKGIQMSAVECLHTYVSDHRALIADLDI